MTMIDDAKGGRGAPRQQVAVWRPRQVAGIEMVRGGATPHSAPRHFHEEFEIALRRGGGWEFHYRGVWHAVAAGTLVLTPPGAVHMVRSSRAANGAMFHGLRLDADLLQRTATNLAGHPQRVPDFTTLFVRDRGTRYFLLRLVAGLEERVATSPLEQDSWLQDALGHLILRHGAAKLTMRPVGAEHRAVQRARQYLEEHAEQQVALAELARVADLSAFYLCRAFGAVVGMPPHAYQTQLRITRAKALLVAGQLPLAQIAAAVGFASQSHFRATSRASSAPRPANTCATAADKRDRKNVVDDESPRTLCSPLIAERS